MPCQPRWRLQWRRCQNIVIERKHATSNTQSMTTTITAMARKINVREPVCTLLQTCSLKPVVHRRSNDTGGACFDPAARIQTRTSFHTPVLVWDNTPPSIERRLLRIRRCTTRGKCVRVATYVYSECHRDRDTIRWMENERIQNGAIM